MAHNTRVRAPGFWISLSTLLPAEMESFDAQLYKAINGDGGGVWAPSAVIEIGGSGIKITGACQVTSLAQLQFGAAITGGNLTVSLNASVQGTLTVQGSAILQGGANITGGNLTVSLDADVQGNLTAGVVGIGGAVEGGYALKVTGAAKVTGALDVLGLGTFATAQVTGAFQVGGATTLAGAVSLTQPLTPSGSGRVRVRPAIGADANTTYNAGDADVILIRPGDLSAPRTYTLGTTGAAAGDRIVFTSRTNVAASISVPSNASENRIVQTGVSTDREWVEYTFFSDGKWWLTGSYTTP